LKLGIIYINNIQMPQPELLSNVDDRNRKRLIYFRRITKEIAQTGNVLNTTVLYFLGYQFNDKNGKNCKKIIQIDELGNIII